MKLKIVFGCETECVGETRERFLAAVGDDWKIPPSESTILIFSGSSSAVAMARKFYTNWYPPAVADAPYETVLVEKYSQSTLENVQFSLRALKILRYRQEQFDEIILVSSWYHLLRIRSLWRLNEWGQLPVRLVPVWNFSTGAIFNALLEPLKAVFDLVEILDGWREPHKFLNRLQLKLLHGINCH